jgi:transposase-like protein
VPGQLDGGNRNTLEKAGSAGHIRTMRKSDIICPECNAGYRRIELATRKGTRGEYRCLLCDHVLEVFDGSTEVAIRLTVQPEKTFQ